VIGIIPRRISRHKELSLARQTSSTHGLPRKDEATIATLAQETETDAAVVRSLYEEEMDKLHAESSVKSFIGVIAARRVRERIAEARENGRPLKVQAA
jgi:DNA transposition AAA+ family ATPase